MLKYSKYLEYILLICYSINIFFYLKYFITMLQYIYYYEVAIFAFLLELVVFL